MIPIFRGDVLPFYFDVHCLQGLVAPRVKATLFQA